MTQKSALLGLLDDANAILGAVEAESAESDDVKALVGAYIALTNLKKGISDISDLIQAKIAENMTEKRQNFGSTYGWVEKHKEVSTKWDHEGLVGMMHRISQVTDVETGEITVDGPRLGQAIRECAAFSYWRITKLKQYGIDPDEYSEKKWGRPRIRLLGKEAPSGSKDHVPDNPGDSARKDGNGGYSGESAAGSPPLGG